MGVGVCGEDSWGTWGSSSWVAEGSPGGALVTWEELSHCLLLDSPRLHSRVAWAKSNDGDNGSNDVSTLAYPLAVHKVPLTHHLS
jgi:hypothetical protein